jgi:hypothetical protein
MGLLGVRESTPDQPAKGRPFLDSSINAARSTSADITSNSEIHSTNIQEPTMPPTDIEVFKKVANINPPNMASETPSPVIQNVAHKGGGFELAEEKSSMDTVTSFAAPHSPADRQLTSKSTFEAKKGFSGDIANRAASTEKTQDVKQNSSVSIALFGKKSESSDVVSHHSSKLSLTTKRERSCKPA